MICERGDSIVGYSHTDTVQIECLTRINTQHIIIIASNVSVSIGITFSSVGNK